MADWDNYEEVNHKVTHVIFLIDVSENMKGKKIDVVNNTMESIVRELSEKDSADFDLHFAVLSFETDCTWVTGNSLIPCDMGWQLPKTGTFTSFNTACRELNEKLSGKEGGFFNFAVGKTITPPIIVLLNAGYATDGNPDGKDGIKELKKNKYFKEAYKLAIAIGDNANQQLCINFTGDEEFVYTAYNEKAFMSLIYGAFKDSIFVVDDDQTTSITAKNSYFIDGSVAEYDRKINICKCQYGKILPNETLDIIYEIEYKLDNVLCIKNSSNSEQEISVYLKLGGTLKVMYPKEVKLFHKSVPIKVSEDSNFCECFKVIDDWDNDLVWD